MTALEEEQFEPLFDEAGNWLKAATKPSKARAPAAAPVDRKPRRARAAVRRFADIAEEQLEPIFPGMLWIGKYTAIAGDPGGGKSVTSCDVAARITRGGKVSPYSAEAFEPRNVVICSSEDGAGDTIKPRLRVAGADMSRVFSLAGVFNEKGELEHTDMRRHLQAIGECMRDNKASLLIMDPVSSFLGRIDSNSQSDVRGVVDPMQSLMQQLRFAMLGIVHLNKGTGMNAIYRLGGSVAMVGAPRMVFGFVRDESQGSNGDRLLLPIKANLQPDEAGYSLRLVDCNGFPKIEWHTTRSDVRIDDALTAAKGPSNRDRAFKLLDDLMVPGQEVPAGALEQLCAEHGIGKNTRLSVLGVMGAEKQKKGGGGWTWRIPVPAETFDAEPTPAPRAEQLAETIRAPLSAAASQVRKAHQ